MYNESIFVCSYAVADGKGSPLLGSIDIERQCGVPLREGRRCGGSLACKRHSMSSKRAVAGRSAPYDQLLATFMERRRAERALEEAV